MKILITGATGLLGGHLLQTLQQRGEQIRALILPVENADKLIAQGVEVERGDVTDDSTLAPAVKDIEIIFHLAGMMGVNSPIADYRLVNVRGYENLYRAAQAVGVRWFVHTSAHTVYGLGYGRFLTEKDALRPDRDPYSITKAEGDRLIRRLMLKSDMETVIIRPGTFFGPGDRLHYGRIAQRMKNGKGVIIGGGDNALPFCYVTDVVQGFLLAAYHEKAPGNVYNISNDRPLTQQEMFYAIADDVGGKRPTRHLPYLPIYYGSIVAEKVALVTRTKGNLLCNDAAIVDRQIGQVPCRAFSAYIICNGIEHLLLCKRAVVRDVIDITRSLLMIGRQQKALHHIRHVAEWQRVISSSNNYPLAILHALSDATVVQSISWPEEGARTDDHRLHIAFEHEASDQTITLCFGNAVGVRVWSHCILLGEESPITKPIDSMRTGMNETAYACCLSRPVEILRTTDIHQAIICK